MFIALTDPHKVNYSSPDEEKIKACVTICKSKRDKEDLLLEIFWSIRSMSEQHSSLEY